jgi:hypothetical protein
MTGDQPERTPERIEASLRESEAKRAPGRNPAGGA